MVYDVEPARRRGREKVELQREGCTELAWKWLLSCARDSNSLLSGVKGIAIVSFERILYCMVLRLS